MSRLYGPLPAHAIKNVILVPMVPVHCTFIRDCVFILSNEFRPAYLLGTTETVLVRWNIRDVQAGQAVSHDHSRCLLSMAVTG